MAGRGHLRIAVALALSLPAGLLSAEDAGSAESLATHLEARRLEEVLAHVGALPAGPERDSIWVAARSLHTGPDAGVELAGTLATLPRERARILVGAAMRCLRMREYDATLKLLEAGVAEEPPRSSSEERLGLVMTAVFTGLRRHEDLGIGRSDPRFPAVRMLAAFAGVPDERDRVFAAELGHIPASTLDRVTRSPADLSEVGLKSFLLPPDVMLDLALAVSDFTITGEPALGWRVRMRVPFSQTRLDLFVVLEDEQARLLGMAGARMPPILWGLGKRAGALVDGGDLAGARQWIEWARESLGQIRDTSWARFFVSSTPEAIATAEGLRTAAAALTSSGSLRLLASRGAVPAAAAVPLVPSATLPPGAVPFTDRMTRPVLRSSPNGRRSPDYPLEVRQVGVSGLLIVRCILSVEGKPEECIVVKPLLPALDREVLAWLAASTWSPVTLDGKPQRVSYVFNFNFRLETPAPGQVPPANR